MRAGRAAAATSERKDQIEIVIKKLPGVSVLLVVISGGGGSNVSVSYFRINVDPLFVRVGDWRKDFAPMEGWCFGGGGWMGSGTAGTRAL